MRTTVTLDDDVLRQLRERAHRESQTLTHVLNDVVRRGLRSGPPGQPVMIAAKRRGFRVGVDPSRLNQLVDQLEVEDFNRELRRDAP